MQTPYGDWPSTFSAAAAAAASRDFAELRVDAQGLFWSEFDPRDARCILWHHRNGRSRCLTPSGFSLGSRVHEYGGGAFCLLPAGVAFVNEADQQIYLQSLDGLPVRLGLAPDCRYGDLLFDALGQALLVVEERHGPDGVDNRLVSIALADCVRRVVAEGADFYAAPTLSADGQRLAWIEWARPAQPWTATRLCLVLRVGAGAWSAPRVVAGDQVEEALQQPRFDMAGRLLCLSDRQGWWQPWGEVEGGWAPEPGMAQADHGAAPWQLGGRSYWPLAAGRLLLSRFEQGFGLLLERDAQGRERRLATDFSRFRGLAADETHIYCIANAPDRLPAVLAIERASARVRLLAGGEQPLAAAQLSLPEPLSLASGAGEQTHGFFYPPRNADCQAPEDERPPLVVFMHGGPTSACYPQLDPRIQFWTQRGFAVVDLNYRGSSGYGRAYRQRLRGEWGLVEVEDACAVVAHLGQAGRIDPARAFIRGASAGGYSTLCALAFQRVFRGGASLYGVSDPLALGRVTHKFEADYLDWLIGDPERDLERYRARTPLLHAERIEVPVIFFQGGLDAVVLPQQTESMVAALQARGIAVEYRCYADERHGFRQAAHLAEVLELEWAFYRRLLAG
ncbi:MAG TPA: S9 family peptidase [Pseudomonas sp.]|nr:S9 family peptidase [Pseudomonas sp.]